MELIENRVGFIVSYCFNSQRTFSFVEVLIACILSGRCFCVVPCVLGFQLLVFSSRVGVVFQVRFLSLESNPICLFNSLDVGRHHGGVKAHVEQVVTAKVDELNERNTGLLSGRSNETCIRRSQMR